MRIKARSRPTPSRPDRRQRIPPALTRGTERLEAISILDEIPTDLGLVLWRSARNVLLWAETPPSSRGALFAGDAGSGRVQLLSHLDAEPELRAPLLVIADLLARPASAGLLRVVNACRRIALWAEGRGALATALEFTQAAALASPDSASLAFAVGRLARRGADYDRAESWYTRAAIQARENEDWRSYASALAGMGNLHVQRGNLPAARRVHLRCLQASTRHHVREMVAASYHNLFGVAVEMQVGSDADPLAARALEAYRGDFAATRRLAYDVAYHWVQLGYFAGALKLAQTLAPHVRDDLSVSAIVHGLIGRAAGGLGNAEVFDRATLDVDELLSSPAVHEEMTARTLLGLAHGALSLGRSAVSAAYADEVLSIARKRFEGRIVIEAEALLDAARHEQGVANRSTPVVTPVPELVEQFVEALDSSPAYAGV